MNTWRIILPMTVVSAFSSPAVFADDDCVDKVTVAHMRGGHKGPILIDVCQAAVPAHMAHGDFVPVIPDVPSGESEIQVSLEDHDGDSHYAAYNDLTDELLGTVAGGDDCDDTDADINPDARELLGPYLSDGEDNNCDGLIDGVYVNVTVNGQDYQVYSVGESLSWGPYGNVEAIPTYQNLQQLYSDFDGEDYTAALVALGGYPAAQFCADLTWEGFDDWYLPAAGELWAVQDVLPLASGFLDNYWSSNEAEAGYEESSAVMVEMVNGQPLDNLTSFNKPFNQHVACVRKAN